MSGTLKIGSRGSQLALWQAHYIQQRLKDLGVKSEIKIIRTTGDKITGVPLAKVGGKGLFTKEIEEALLDGRVDLAVHSLKDLPTELPEGLALAAVPERVVDVLRGAIRRASDRSRLVARVHPDDLAVCRDAAAEVTERMGGIGAFEVVDDPRIGRGSCLLETGTGDVDATFESQLARVLEALVAPPDMTLVAGG